MTKTIQGFKFTKDGAMLIHKDLVTKVEGDSIKIPQTDTAYGAGFGDSITDSDRAFAAEREPVAHFLTFGVANDVTEKWFTIDDPDTEEADPALDRNIQQVYMKLKFKQRLTEAYESERTYGKAYLVCGFNDAKSNSDLVKPLRKNAELLQISVYPLTVNANKTKECTVDQIDTNPESPRYGEPEIYKLHRGGTAGNTLIHYTRVYELKTRTTGSSVLDPIWDDLNCGRNIRWGAAQWMYRTGGGFPVVGFPAGTTAAQLEAYHNTGAFTGLMSRTGIFIAQNSQMENDGMTFDFKGAASAALDPVPFFKSNIEQIAIATGIPQAKLVGAQAGAVTGSEVNVQDYYKVVSREQAKLEDCIRWFNNKLSESGQISYIKAATDKPDTYHVRLLKSLLRRVVRRDYRHKTADQYIVNWNSAFELSEKDEAAIEESHVRANQGKLDYMSIDEVRAEMNLDPLPNGAGKWKDQSELFGGGGEQFLVSAKGRKPNEQKSSKENNSGNSGNAGS